ncbi:uncharacterized protein TNCV_3834891 [Trichonephila clavipes]|nr:uncharacterized protein TNCV_3834891 [Trichonephila clavipes]
MLVDGLHKLDAAGIPVRNTSGKSLVESGKVNAEAICNTALPNYLALEFLDKKVKPVGNVMKGFKEYGIEPHNYFVFSGHGYAAAKSTNYNVVGDAIEINCANPQTLVVENQHINPSEEPELTANTDSDSPKKPVSVFFISNHCLKQHNVRKKEKAKKSYPVIRVKFKIRRSIVKGQRVALG